MFSQVICQWRSTGTSITQSPRVVIRDVLSETNMASALVVKRSVLNVGGKSFDVILSQTQLSWGHVGIEDCRLGNEINFFVDDYIITTQNFRLYI